MSEHSRNSKNRRQRRGRLVVASTAVGAFLALGAGPLAVAPAAHADIDDLIFQPVIEAVEQVVNLVDPGLLDDSGADSFAASALDTGDPTNLSGLGSLDAWIAELFGADTGDSADAHAGIAEANPAAESGEVPSSATVPIDVNPTSVSSTGETDGGEPVVDVSVGGGNDTPVLIDTGSNGLTVPWQDVNWLNVGFPSHLGIGGFSGGLWYVYLTVPTTVEFGDNGTLVTDTTDVNAVLFSFPTTMRGLLDGDWTINSFLGPAGADGILGIGGNAAGPSDHNPIEDLPGDLGKGVLIDQAKHTMTFGANPLTDGTAIDGSPNAPLWVQIDDGDLHKVNGVMDSGGAYGAMPSSVLSAGEASNGALVPGTTVSVYSSDDAEQAPLYAYTVGPNSANSPIVTAGESMNTGNWLFQQNPVYIGMGGNGSTYVGGTLGGQ